ncbi:MAG: tol-pal system-associated acyl-CoA thioesterase [Chromatiaceae bacterium]|nr:tol-pal system-associated acyl-CoA thioesterase [Chromatiaceae bacterium]
MSSDYDQSGSASASFVWPIRVYYEDTDAAGVVFYANYLRFMERARTEWLRALGFEQDALREREGIVFAVRQVRLDYLSPARFNEELRVRTWITAVGGASLEFAQRVERAADASLCCEGQVRIACIDAHGLRPHRLPAILRSCIEAAAHPVRPLESVAP